MSQQDGIIVYSTEDTHFQENEMPPKENAVKIEFFNEVVKTLTEIDCDVYKKDKNEIRFGFEDSQRHLEKKFKLPK